MKTTLRESAKEALDNLRKIPEVQVHSQRTRMKLTGSMPRNQRVLPIGEIRLTGGDVLLRVYGFSLKDNSWTTVSLGKYKVRLQLASKQPDYNRQLDIVLHESALAKNVEVESKANKGQSERTNNIFRIPHASLIMHTQQQVDANVIPFYFLTNFNEPLVISLDIALYKFLHETAVHYLRAFNSEPTKSPANLPKDSIAASKYSPTDLRVFDCKSFKLEPTLNVLGDYTPKVQTVLGWMKMKHADKTIPTVTHMVLTDNLENTLRSLVGLAIQITKI